MRIAAVALLSLGMTVNVAMAEAEAPAMPPEKPAESATLDLLGALRLAYANDPNVAAVLALRNAASAATTIGRSALLPYIAAQGSYSEELLKNSLGKADYTQTTWGAKAIQPLFHWDAWFQYQGLQAQRSQQEAEADSRLSDLALAVSDAYFNVLRAQDSLALAKAQETALTQRRDQAKAQYEVGVLARADMIEAEAQRDSAEADRLSAEIQLGHARDVLRTALATDFKALTPLPEQFAATPVFPDDAEAWVDLAEHHNPSLQAARFGATVASKNKEAQRAGLLPSINLYASTGDKRISELTGTNQSVFFSSGRQSSVGVEATWELFAGGRTLAFMKQAGYQADAAREQANALEHRILNNTRTAFLTVKTDSQRLAARERAQTSAQLAYEAAKAGYEVGTRNMLDLLQAETRLYAAKREFANARYDYVLNSLRLQALTGQLTEASVAEMNARLVP